MLLLEMTAPVCAVVEAAEVAALGDSLVTLWVLTIVGLLLSRVDLWAVRYHVRRFLRRRRIQRIRAARFLVGDEPAQGGP